MSHSMSFSYEKKYRLRDNVGRQCTAGQATDDDLVHMLCMLDN